MDKIAKTGFWHPVFFFLLQESHSFIQGTFEILPFSGNGWLKRKKKLFS
ncbi:hypothetical protein JOD44_002500 [Salimicrobium jeotgali]|nr:hypothetical protein [Salimicrobium jeotgali]